MKIKSLLLLSTLLNSLPYPSYLMASANAEELVAPETRPAIIIKTPRALFDFTNNIMAIREARNFDEISKLLNPLPVLDCQEGNFTVSDLEVYYFESSSALYDLYVHQAVQNKLNPIEAVRHYATASQVFSEYLKLFGKDAPMSTSKVKSCNDRMKWHRFYIFDQLGKCYRKLFEQVLHQLSPGEQRQFLIQEINYYNQAVEIYDNEVVPLVVELGINKKTPGTDLRITQIKYNLFTAYCMLIQDSPWQEEVSKYFKNAKKIQAYLKNEDHYLYLLSVRSIAATEKILKEKDRAVILGNPQSRLGPKIKKLKLKKSDQVKSEIMMDFKGIQEDTPAHPTINPAIIIRDLQTTLYLLLESAADTSILTAKLNQFEETIKELLSPDKQTLLDIYQTYSDLVKDGDVNAVLLRHSRILLTIGDVEQAYERIKVLQAIEMKKNGNISFLTRALAAGIKNFLGDHADYLAMLVEVEEKANQIKAKMAAKKAAKKAREIAKHAQEYKNKIEEANTITDVEDREDTAIQSPPRAAIAAAAPEDLPSPPLVSTKEEKQEKLTRHLEAQKSKLASASLPAAEIAAEVLEPPVVLEALPEILPKINEVYHLTSKPARIDNQIETGQWKLTREDLQLYFEALDCHYQPAHGSHAKVALPKADLVLVEDQVITVLNTDFGGALTLPEWDKIVPLYLRKQILVAREKLVRFKLKAQSKGELI